MTCGVPSWTVSPTGRSRPDSGCFSLLDRYLIGSVTTAGRRERGRAGGGAVRSRRRAACCGRGPRRAWRAATRRWPAGRRDGAGGAGAIRLLPEPADLAADIGLGIEPRPGNPGSLSDAGERYGSAGPAELAERLYGSGPGQLVPPGRGPGERVRMHRRLPPRRAPRRLREWR